MRRWTDPRQYEFIRTKAQELGWQSRALWEAFKSEFPDSDVNLNTFIKFAGRVKGGAEAPEPEPELDIHEIARAKAAELDRAREKRMMTQLLGQQAGIEQVVDAIREVVPVLPRMEIPRWDAPPLIDGSSPQTALLLLSDAHVGQMIRPGEVQGLGAYNYDVFLNRRDRLVETTRSIIRHHQMSHPVDKLHIAWLGDNVEGDSIFPSQRLGIDRDLMAQVFDASRELGSIPPSFLDLVETVDNTCVVGNHGRVGRRGENLSYVNWDYVVYRTMEMSLSHYSDRIRWDIPESFFATPTIDGWNWLFWHGDDIKSWSGISWYGIQRAMSNWMAIYNSQEKRLDYAAIGHFHKHAEIEQFTNELFVNGSFVGTNEFSLRLRSVALPTQLLMFIHPKWGITARYPIILDRADGALRQPPIAA